jgi:hypothetical protein
LVWSNERDHGNDGFSIYWRAKGRNTGLSTGRSGWTYAFAFIWVSHGVVGLIPIYISLSSGWMDNGVHHLLLHNEDRCSQQTSRELCQMRLVKMTPQVWNIRAYYSRFRDRQAYLISMPCPSANPTPHSSFSDRTKISHSVVSRKPHGVTEGSRNTA